MEILESMESILRFLTKKIPLLKGWNFPLLIVLAINFIPQIFFVWEQVGLAVKARTFRKNRYNFILKLKILIAQFSGVISCMLHRSDEIRKAIVSRS
jgi:energy-coupling factor transporter transmembrane protein EcfT